MASQWFVKVSGAFKEVNEAFVKVSGNWKEIQEGYIKVSGAWKKFYQAFVATAFTTQTSTTTVTVPSGANAIHVRQAVGGGAAGVSGAEYDKSGGESGGTGGGSGAYVANQVFTVVEGETLTLTIGTPGTNSQQGSYPNYSAESGNNTQLAGSSTGTLFTLGGGGGGGSSGGSSPNGSVRTNTASSGGTVSNLGTVLTSGTFKESDGSESTIPSATSLVGGVITSYNQSGSGVAGTIGVNCSGDNCNQAGSNGGASYNGAVAGGSGNFGSTGGSGSQGSGGGGGGAQPQTSGGAGGTGEIVYRFLRVT
jgi:hypothetical protein|tara:strand:+ start:428 stop:1351 length:924 start_codon:yes stop_codon:yes gene_type:complete